MWREAFNDGRPSNFDTEFGLEYTFGPPATEEQLARAEEALGLMLPQELRELLSEFNGVWVTSEAGRENDDAPELTYLDVEHMAFEVPTYFRTSGNPLPPASDLQSVVFLYQENGFADLYGVCARDVAGFKAGEVVHLDHEKGALENVYPNLKAFVRYACRDW